MSAIQRIVDGMEKKLAQNQSLQNTDAYKTYLELLTEISLTQTFQTGGSSGVPQEVIAKLERAAQRV